MSSKGKAPQSILDKPLKNKPWLKDDQLCKHDKRESCTNWIVGDIIGVGEFGAVYAACCEQSGKIDCSSMVLKCLKYSDKVLHGEFIPRYTLDSFKKEVSILKQCSKAGLCPKFVDAWKCGSKRKGGGVIIMNMAGIEARIHLKNNRSDAKKALTKILISLHKLHSVGIAHGDLHLSNMMITQRGEYIFIDMGLSEKLDDENRQFYMLQDYMKLYESFKLLNFEEESRILYDIIDEMTENKTIEEDHGNETIIDQYGVEWNPMFLDEEYIDGEYELDPTADYKTPNGDIVRLSDVLTRDGRNLIEVIQEILKEDDDSASS